MSEQGGDLPKPPGPREPEFHPRQEPEPQPHVGLRDRLKHLGRKATDVLVPRSEPLSPQELTMPTFARLILGGGEASEASPGLTQGQIEGLIGYDHRPTPDTKEYNNFLQSSAAARRLMGDLLVDGTMRIVREKQPSGEIIPTYALADKARLEAHANPRPPTMQAHPR